MSKLGSVQISRFFVSEVRENIQAAVALHFAYYNFVKRHNILRATRRWPGIQRDFWSVGHLIEAAA